MHCNARRLARVVQRRTNWGYIDGQGESAPQFGLVVITGGQS
jgi:hypothetical protein